MKNPFQADGLPQEGDEAKRIGKDLEENSILASRISCSHLIETCPCEEGYLEFRFNAEFNRDTCAISKVRKRVCNQ